tara:strand:+ start:80 stop:448 length:369 start_codon:yes stop_codon:yes gene_type:complete
MDLFKKVADNMFNYRWLLGCVFIFLFVIFMNITVSWSQVKSSVTCKPLPMAAGVLEGLHKERIVFRGVSNRGHVTIIHLNKETGTWSANVILPTDLNSLCMVDAGTTGEITDTTFTNKSDLK